MHGAGIMLAYAVVTIGGFPLVYNQREREELRAAAYSQAYIRTNAFPRDKLGRLVTIKLMRFLFEHITDVRNRKGYTIAYNNIASTVPGSVLAANELPERIINGRAAEATEVRAL
jgi:hypothetical protein